MAYTYRIYGYDLFGNDDEGYEVNDVYRGPLVEFATICKHEGPTDAQIREALAPYFALPAKIRTDGDDLAIYVDDPRTGKPLCELRLIDE